MAEEDLSAARSLLLESHPGAVPEVGDVAFQGQLEKGFEQGLASARAARTYGAYRAALQGFAAGFGDPHIATAPLVQTNRHWPGFIVALGEDGWKVIARVGDDTPQVGAALLSCDGATPDVLARERLAPFTGSWSVPGERIRQSTWLLQDVGNPAHPRLQRCEFQGGDGPRSFQLQWRPIGPPEIARQIAAVRPFPSEEVSLQRFEEGYWIRLGTSGGAAVPILAEAQRHEAALRASRFLVLDLRGNDGGASYFTDELAKRIYGAGRVEAARRPRGTREAETIVWRASPPSLQRVEEYIQRTSRLASPEDPMALGLVAQREALRRSLAGGLPLARAPARVQGPTAVRERDEVKRPPRVILVTDRHCFSSCLLAVRLFRTLGAEHVGEGTRANTRYSDLRTVDLPSGLSNFSTMQSFSTWLPKEVGPYAPSERFDGNFAEDAAVQAWVRTLITRHPPPAKRLRPSRPMSHKRGLRR